MSMNSEELEKYYDILDYELIPAYGCTEPSALAYAAAYAASVLGSRPTRIEAYCSSSIIKNVHSVDIPNARTLKGARAAVILGALMANPEEKLCILQHVTPEVLEEAERLFAEGFCTVSLVPDVDGLFIRIVASTESDNAEVEIIREHTNVSLVMKNGRVLEQAKIRSEQDESVPDRSFLSVQGIIDFADSCDIGRIAPVLENQIKDNLAIANEGLHGDYGASIGKNLMDMYGRGDVRILARAAAAAGSDARMSGCVMPVVINSGSGNQGITVSVPVVEYALKYQIPHEKLLRALAVANLVAILQKRTVGNLSAFCGAVHAAAGAGCGIAYMLGYGYEAMSNVISYTLGTIGGMLCDGAKASCAAKISQALDTAITGLQLSVDYGKSFHSGDGLVKENVEKTIDSFGVVGKYGMTKTNEVVLETMLEQESSETK
ncbi:MAG: serine dehydratase subunit alpha family protein [Spirochaetales bacterium]|nr:serine dehydratase subunit alpha family protein [Spirochaetales bacterium]